MRTGLILTIFCLILVLFCVYSASGLVAINSRGELVACNGNDCDLFNPAERGVDYLPRDYFDAKPMEEISFFYNRISSNSTTQKVPGLYTSNFNVASLEAHVYALDLDGNLWKCNIFSQNCSELNLGISGFKVINSSSTTEKNIKFIVAGISTLFIAGKDGTKFAVWEYNPSSGGVVQKFKDPSEDLVLGDYSVAYPLFRNNTSIGFVGYNNSNATSWCYKPIKINYGGSVEVGDMNCHSGGSCGACYANMYTIIPGLTSGNLEGIIYNGMGEEVDVSIDSTTLKPTVSYNGATTSQGIGVKRLGLCAIVDGIKIDVYQKGVKDPIKVPLTINGAGIDCGSDVIGSKDINYSRYFDPHFSTLWFTYDDAGNNRLGACSASLSGVTCVVSNITVPKIGDSVRPIDFVQGYENSIFVKPVSNDVQLCNLTGGVIVCTEFFSNSILYASKDWSGNLSFTTPVNQYFVSYGKFASLLTNDYVNTAPPGKAFYVIDSVGALYSCGFSSSCIIVNPGIMFNRIQRGVEYSKYTNKIVAWDSAGKLWNCAIDGSGCNLISKEMIHPTNLKVVSNNFALSSDCPSYHIPNSDCNNNCLSGFKKVNDVCVAVNINDVFGIYFYNDSNIYRCTKNNCLQLPSISTSIQSMKASQKRGVIAIADNNRIIECIDNSCNLMYSETGFDPKIIVPAKSGVFAVTYNSSTSVRKIIFVEYGNNTFVTLTNQGVSGTYKGFSFEDTVYLSGKYCNKFGCTSHEDIGYHDNIGGLYKFGSEPNIGYYWSQNEYLSYYPVTGSDYGQISFFNSGAAIPAISNNKKSHVIISPYFAHGFNSLDSVQMPPVSGIVEDPGFGGAYIKEENAWLVKSNLVASNSNIYGDIAYCTEYGCKNINCDLNFYSRVIYDGYYERRLRYHIVPAYEVRLNEGITILGYVLDQNAKDDSPGKVMAIIRQDGEIYPECVNLNPSTDKTNWHILASSNGRSFVTHSGDVNMSYCSYPDCNLISTGVTFNPTLMNIADDVGGLFTLKHGTKYTPYYCNSTSCNKITDLNFKFTAAIVAYQLPISICGDGVCSTGENYIWCPQDCPACGDDNTCNPACAPGTDPDCADPCISDGMCNPVCPIGTDPDCPSCGNDIIDLGEECDGVSSNCESNEICSACLCVPDCSANGFCNDECPAGADPDCVDPLCGNDIVEPGEECGEPNLFCSGIKICENCRCVFPACPPSWFDCNGDGICESDEPCDNNANSIIEFELIVKNDLVYSNAQCTINGIADLNIYFEDVLIFSKTIPCEENSTESLIGPIDFNEGVNKGILKINTPCNVCDKVDYFAITSNKDAKIPDNNFLGIFIILASVLVIFSIKNKSLN